MYPKEKILVSWSGGKDSGLSLYEILKDGKFEISALLTVFTGDYDRVSMHGIRRIMLEKQVEHLGYFLEKIFIPKNASNNEYKSQMVSTLQQYKSNGISSIVFGDMFLEDVRKYREENLSKICMTALFPLWKKDTFQQAKKFINLGFKSIVTCIDSKSLSKDFVGRMFDKEFLSALPSNVDPMGENGEFHSFVFDGPLFKRRVKFELGDIVLRDERFYFCDLIPL
ncbi:Dph6-related ATP pyrophosphatase [[Eubacterium] cellulosolvens]